MQSSVGAAILCPVFLVSDVKEAKDYYIKYFNGFDAFQCQDNKDIIAIYGQRVRILPINDNNKNGNGTIYLQFNALKECTNAWNLASTGQSTVINTLDSSAKLGLLKDKYHVNWYFSYEFEQKPSILKGII